MKIGDFVEFATDPAYHGQIIGARESGDGWWVRDPSGTSNGQVPDQVHPANAQLTYQVRRALAGQQGKVWHSAESNMRLMRVAPQPGGVQDAPAVVPAIKPPQHVAGLSTESIDWDAHRAFLRGGMQ